MAGQRFADLVDTVAVGIENDDMKVATLLLSLEQVVVQLLVVGCPRVNDGQLVAHGCR